MGVCRLCDREPEFGGADGALGATDGKQYPQISRMLWKRAACRDDRRSSLERRCHDLQRRAEATIVSQGGFDARQEKIMACIGDVFEYGFELVALFSDCHMDIAFASQVLLRWRRRKQIS